SDKFKFYRTAFKATTVEEAEYDIRQHKHMSVKERFELMHYLNSIAYNYSKDNPPRMEKVFSCARKLINE
ncbi:MAG: hypothetical protein MUF24_14360, partial [Chitinophagaceae bacterium]|nr:hypothetical protein [Chitinophagaceae bacterium]